MIFFFQNCQAKFNILQEVFCSHCYGSIFCITYIWSIFFFLRLRRVVQGSRGSCFGIPYGIFLNHKDIQKIGNDMHVKVFVCSSIHILLSYFMLHFKMVDVIVWSIFQGLLLYLLIHVHTFPFVHIFHHCLFIPLFGYPNLFLSPDSSSVLPYLYKFDTSFPWTAEL